jgi:hypothetical protein
MTHFPIGKFTPVKLGNENVLRSTVGNSWVCRIHGHIPSNAICLHKGTYLHVCPTCIEISMPVVSAEVVSAN